jgi:tRNA-(ms[2]io[6]A)-hydroxylase
MLGLKMATDPRWVDIAEKSIEEILTDHAYCEQKAASNGISLIIRFSEFPEMIDEVTSLVAEEWGHFRKVIKELKKRGYHLGKRRKDDYVLRLNAFQKRGQNRKWQLVEQLLVCAMIEARSCERFRLLSLHISDPDLKEFYHEFMVSEAGHYRMFIDLARSIVGREEADERWAEYLEFEAKMIQELEWRTDRVH